MDADGETLETKPVVLIVDDVPENIDILVGLLGSMYQLRIATRGERAISIAMTSEPPDLILLDIMMPEMNGFEVCKRLKKIETLAQVPIIFISALNQLDDKVDGFNLGGADYITKPFQPEEVKARVNTHLELHRQRKELAEYCKKLKALEQLRDNLTNMMVHDMRSPLSGILMALELLQVRNEGSKNAKYINNALTSGNLLCEMISSLLDVSRMEAGEMPLTLCSNDVSSIVSSALSSLAGLTSQLEVVFEPPAEEMIAFCDTEITRRIMVNLLANAIKFTPSDKSVKISLEHKDNMIQASVTDSGPGIPPEAFSSIFEKFGQVQNAQTQANTKYSTGLGLTFCKLAVEAQHGSIGLNSEVDQGSTFWFTLPCKENSGQLS